LGVKARAPARVERRAGRAALVGHWADAERFVHFRGRFAIGRRFDADAEPMRTHLALR
jgi:hypothetical protein